MPFTHALKPNLTQWRQDISGTYSVVPTCPLCYNLSMHAQKKFSNLDICIDPTRTPSDDKIYVMRTLTDPHALADKYSIITVYINSKTSS